MYEANLIRVHEAWIAHHIAPIRKVDGQHRASPVFDRARTVLVKSFVVVRANVAPGKDFFEVLEERRIDGHHVFEVSVFLAVFDHENLSVAFDDLSFDFADSFVQQYFVRQFAIDDLLPDFRNALRAQRIGCSGPAQRRLGLLI